MELPDWWPHDKPYAIMDCLEGMKELPDKCVDLVLTDPPYKNLKGDLNITFNNGVGELKQDSTLVGDMWGANLEWLPEAWRICKHGLITFVSHHFIKDVLITINVAPICLITWHVPNAMPSQNNVPQYRSEYLLAFKKDPGLKWRKLKTHYTLNKLNTGCMASKERLVDKTGKAIHPTQKPVKLIEDILDIGPSTVLDPFLGTGTTLIACRKTDRIGLGFEINPDYEPIIRKRGMDEIEIDGKWHQKQKQQEWW